MIASTSATRSTGWMRRNQSWRTIRRAVPGVVTPTVTTTQAQAVALGLAQVLAPVLARVLRPPRRLHP